MENIDDATMLSIKDPLRELPEIRREGHFGALMRNADTLQEVCLDYFGMSRAPNIAGLCAYLGTTPIKLRNLFVKYSDLLEADDGDERWNRGNIPSRDALTVLTSALMHIEASVVEGGLIGSYNAHMSKFVLSAFHDRNEKQLHESKSDKNVTIVVESKEPVDLAELKEFQRLEKAIEEQSHIELVSMGRPTETTEDPELII